LTISIASPSPTVVVSYAARLTTARLCSTATLRASMSKRARSAAIVSGPGISAVSPLRRIFKVGLARRAPEVRRDPGLEARFQASVPWGGGEVKVKPFGDNRLNAPCGGVPGGPRQLTWPGAVR
jgi:hypothetical protein